LLLYTWTSLLINCCILIILLSITSFSKALYFSVNIFYYSKIIRNNANSSGISSGYHLERHLGCHILYNASLITFFKYYIGNINSILQKFNIFVEYVVFNARVFGFRGRYKILVAPQMALHSTEAKNASIEYI
jgi:hypothetical protein